MMTVRRYLFGLSAALLLSACSVDRIPGVYRIDIQQGNVVTPASFDELKPGMTQEQVRFIMGTPMITDTFNQGRWDYYFSFKPGRGDPVSHHITLFFSGDVLQRIEGEPQQLPPDVIAASGPRTVAVTGEVPDSRGVLDRAWDTMTDWDFSSDEEPTPEAPAKTADGSATGGT